MKKTYLYSVALAAMLAYAPVSASIPYALADGDKFAIVNIQQIMNDSTAAKSVREQLESKQKTYQSELTRKEDSLKKEEQELEKRRGVLSKDAFAEKARPLIARETEIQKDAQDKKVLLNKAFERSLNDIQKVVTGIIADLAKEKGFDLAVPTSELLYSDSKLDITSEVLERLNKKLSSLEVTFDADAKSSK